jgi:nitronate monooxygenase
VEFFYDTPDPSLISLVHAGGALAGWQVGSVAEARQAVDAGCDLIIAQAWRPAVMCGGRSGCYRCWPMCWTWLPSRYWRPVPSAAPGRWPLHWPPERQGSESGRSFVATEESGAHPDYVAALLVAHAEATILVEAFSVGWPGAPHRVLSSAVVAAEAHPDEAVAMLFANRERVAADPAVVPRNTQPRNDRPCRGHGAVRGPGSRPGHPGGPSRPGSDGVG